MRKLAGVRAPVRLVGQARACAPDHVCFGKRRARSGKMKSHRILNNRQIMVASNKKRLPASSGAKLQP